MHISDILKEKLQYFKENPDKVFKEINVDYHKKWNEGVNCFMKEINKDRLAEKKKPLPFMAVREKLVALKEIDDLRWFFYHCKKYSRTKDKQGNKNTFSKAFFGALKVK